MLLAESRLEAAKTVTGAINMKPVSPLEKAMSSVSVFGALLLGLLLSGCLAGQVIPTIQVPNDRLLASRAAISLPGVDPKTPSTIKWVDEKHHLVAVMGPGRVQIVDIVTQTLKANLMVDRDVAEVSLGRDGHLYMVSQFRKNEPTSIRSFDLSSQRYLWTATLTPQPPSPGSGAQAPASEGFSVAFPEVVVSNDRRTVTVVGVAFSVEGLWGDLLASRTLLARINGTTGAVMSTQLFSVRDRLDAGTNILIDNHDEKDEILLVLDQDWNILQTVKLGAWNADGLREQFNPFGRSVGRGDYARFIAREGYAPRESNGFFRARIDGHVLSLSDWRRKTFRSQLLQLDLQTGRTIAATDFSTSIGFFPTECRDCRWLVSLRDKRLFNDLLEFDGFVEWRPDGSWTTMPIDRSIPSIFASRWLGVDDRGHGKDEQRAGLWPNFHEYGGNVYFCSAVDDPSLYRLVTAERRVEKVAGLGALNLGQPGCEFSGPFAIARSRKNQAVVVDVRNGRTVFTSTEPEWVFLARSSPDGRYVVLGSWSDDSFASFVLSEKDGRIVAGADTGAKRRGSAALCPSGVTSDAYWFVEDRGKQDLVLTVRDYETGGVSRELPLSYFRDGVGGTIPQWLDGEVDGRMVFLYRDHQATLHVYDLGAASGAGAPAAPPDSANQAAP